MLHIPCKMLVGHLAGSRTLEDHTYERLRHVLRSGALAPRQQLAADALAKELGVSRMPVVQALRRLAYEGFVTAEAHKPVRVADPTPEQIRERYLTIVALESLCAREAFQRDPAGVAQALRDRARDQRRRPATAAQDDEADRAFHEVIWDASALPTVVSMLRTLWDQGGYYRVLLFEHGEYRKARLAEHRAIVAAAATGNVDQVIDTLAAHRWSGMARMVEIVEGRDERA